MTTATGSAQALADQRCKPCEGGVAPLDAEAARALMPGLEARWQLANDGKALDAEFRFRDFYRTMSFVNAVAHIANGEDHHPDLRVGYNYCHVRYTTHAIKGLSHNDFVCAAKIDRLV